MFYHIITFIKRVIILNISDLIVYRPQVIFMYNFKDFLIIKLCVYYGSNKLPPFFRYTLFINTWL